MGLFDGCLLACDIDCTLVDNGIISDKNRQKIAFFQKEGGKFSLATGRMVGAVPSEALVQNVAPSVMSNGGVIYDFQNEKILYRASLPKEENIILKQVLQNFADVGAEVHSGFDVYTLQENEENYNHIVYEQIKSQHADFDQIKDLQIDKILYFALDEKRRDEVRNFICSLKCKSKIINTCAVIKRIPRYYVEQIPPDVSKASGVRMLEKLLNIKPGCSFAMGDYYNDLEMIETADISAVPFEAPDDIKLKATITVGSYKNSAVADFIDFLTDNVKNQNIRKD